MKVVGKQVSPTVRNQWLNKQPNPTYMSWAGFKCQVMEYLDVPPNYFSSWDVPDEWKLGFKKQCQKRFR